MVIEILSILFIILWLLFFSRLRLRARLLSTGAIIAAIAVFFLLFEIRGLSGDLAPIFKLRWSNASSGHIVGSRDQETGDAISSGSGNAAHAYPQFLGPGRDATLNNISLVPDWKTSPPQMLWRRGVGAGWSAFAVAGEHAVTQEQHGDLEYVTAYHLMTGKIIWQHGDEARYESVLGGVGPRATPTIHGEQVFTLGATGVLNCLDLRTGEQIWDKNIVEENNAAVPEWGVSCSPLVLDSLVIVSPGGENGRSMVAYHKDTGEMVWAGGNDRAGYSSPTLRTVAGVEQILIFNNSHVAAHHPHTGAVLWKFPWPDQTQRVAQPLVVAPSWVFVTSGYGAGSKVLQIEKDTSGALQAGVVWENNRLKSKFANVVHRDGFVYGLDDGILVCLDVHDGKRQWKRGRYGHGQMMLVDDLLLIISERGDLALVDASPDAYREVAFMPAIDGKTWNNPALAGAYLLVRNSQEAACFKLQVRHELSHTAAAFK